MKSNKIYDILMEEGMNTSQAMRVRDKIMSVFKTPIPDRIQTDTLINITCMTCRKKGLYADFTAKCVECNAVTCFTVGSINHSVCMHHNSIVGEEDN